MSDRKLLPGKFVWFELVSSDAKKAQAFYGEVLGDPGGEPACDTFFQSARHGGVQNATAGVGACKTDLCKFNRDYECSASAVQIGMQHNHADCMTFQQR